MKLSLYALAAAGIILVAAWGCSPHDVPSGPVTAVQTDRAPWYKANPEGRAGDWSAVSDKHRLEFFGWGEDCDKRFTMQFPADIRNYRRAILTYRMGAYDEGPGYWDNTTMLFVKNKADGEWYEIARAFTCYGGSFNSTWSKEFFMDVTEYLPLLAGETEFRLYYGGFDAGYENHTHALTLGFDFYEGKPERTTVYTAKVYDTSRDGNSGYRAWAYGIKTAPIEAAHRLGRRVFNIPAGVKSIEMKVSISGHGHDLGTFPDRPNYRPQNMAEFVENTYTVRINDVPQEKTGLIFYSNADNYPQAGTYRFDRANWAPGNPLNVHYWQIDNLPAKGGELEINLDLENFVSAMNNPNADAPEKTEGVAQYIIEVDLFGFDK